MANPKFRTHAVMLADTSNMPEPEWHEWRRKGIGGSDLAAIMGMSPWQTARDIYYKKKGIVGAMESEADNENWVAKEVGHRLESLVAKIFQAKTGLEPFEVKQIFAHPVHQFMIANVDFFVTLPDGRTAILECKTSNINNKEKWDDDTVPLHYELQGRHYMAVLDVDVVFFACLFSNNENDFVWRQVERDLDYEYDIIDCETDFWLNYVEFDIEPPFTEKGDLVIRSLSNHFGKGDKNVPEVTLRPVIAADIEKYLELKSEKAQLEKAVKELDNQMKKAQAAFLEPIGEAYSGICKKDNTVYTITYKPASKTEIDKDGLKVNFPEAYSKCIRKVEGSRRLNVKKKEAS